MLYEVITLSGVVVVVEALRAPLPLLLAVEALFALVAEEAPFDHLRHELRHPEDRPLLVVGEEFEGVVASYNFV